MGMKRAMVVFESVTGLPEDRIVNTFHFAAGGVNDDIFAALTAFYNTGTGSPKDWMSGYALRTANASQVRIYDLADAEPRPPDVRQWTLGGAGGAPLPREVACCLSYYATRNIRRQRGRIYIGPLSTTILENRTGDQGIVAAARTGIGNAAAALASGGPTARWVVHSPANGPESGMPVTAGWVDDAVDIQRRRGLDPTNRTLWDTTVG